MRHLPPTAPQFYVTAPQPCPYLEGRIERKLFTALHGSDANKLNDVLSRQGFRRSQNVLYRPSCADCSACLSARIPVDAFRPNRSLRRVMNRNADLLREPRDTWATEEQFALFRSYLDARHADGGMADMDIYEFAAMVEETPVRSRILEYVQPQADGTTRLMATCLTDVLADGLSLVYSFFDVSETRRSLGTYMILDHIRIAREAGLKYVYLGYWVQGSPKMDYKARFSPLEVYRDGGWRMLAPEDRTAPARSTDLHAQIAQEVAAIELPDITEI
ncbi:arginyltransferase [Oceanomicrobium pacificus]|uniref:Aspartate/glutamate leucyltransferase n=1 Tax=Oceanomicrobium pacificus TaxID=2692916 RepID=A0A6B0TY16_9RHOB|nr:arginyltransferase [Oceanomicrobium pacificus]MXU66182.1 arginyltransferase [Oceanomicrobium pacificus]